MSTLFDTTRIKQLTMRNRLVRSATWEGMCTTDGEPTPKLANLYADLAKGGVGLIVSGYTFVRPDGKQLNGKMGIHTDAFGPAYQRLTQAVHANNGALAIQLVHAGGQANPDQIGRQPLAPSAVQLPQYPATPDALSVEEIQEIVTAFGEGARRAKAWGFDAVQFHGAHGYLINQFLSPLTNQRNDAYGGSLENRCRFLFQVYQAVRQTVGEDFPVMIKLNATDHLEGGLAIDDALYAAAQLDKMGIDAIEVSSGMAASGKLGPARSKIDAPEKEAYNLALAGQIKATVGCPVMVVGGFRSYEVAENAIRTQGLDYVALSRPLIREPALPNRWQSGDHTPATCISCNKCFIPGMKEGGIYCMVEKKLREKKEKQKGD
jgi:2,4-dienoyl-CoA reductase-like NADH-dependent reductase (Old Yellow Enzyme family)